MNGSVNIVNSDLTTYISVLFASIFHNSDQLTRCYERLNDYQTQSLTGWLRMRHCLKLLRIVPCTLSTHQAIKVAPFSISHNLPAIDQSREWLWISASTKISINQLTPGSSSKTTYDASVRVRIGLIQTTVMLDETPATTWYTSTGSENGPIAPT